MARRMRRERLPESEVAPSTLHNRRSGQQYRAYPHGRTDAALGRPTSGDYRGSTVSAAQGGA